MKRLFAIAALVAAAAFATPVTGPFAFNVNVVNFEPSLQAVTHPGPPAWANVMGMISYSEFLLGRITTDAGTQYDVVWREVLSRLPPRPPERNWWLELLPPRNPLAPDGNNTPEPASIVLLALGLLGLKIRGRPAARTSAACDGAARRRSSST